MDAGLEKVRAGVSLAAQLDGVFAFVDAGQLRLRKFRVKRGQHSTAAATGIDQGKFCSARFDGIGDMLAEGLVPPIMVLDRAHDVVLLSFHASPGLTSRWRAFILQLI